MIPHFTQLLQEYSNQLDVSIGQLLYNALPVDCSDLTDAQLAEALINCVNRVFPHRINQPSTTIDYSSVDQFLIDYHKPTDQILVNCCWLQTQLKHLIESEAVVHKQAKTIDSLNNRISGLLISTANPPIPQYKTLNIYS